ncbi:MAG: autotransporter domain-containing protein [Verrucomicrobia bacterium]|nr:autotransporter domain-containing protein [Verrucomicrobiota bacterium]
MATSLLLGSSKVFGIGPRMWTGDVSSNMGENLNWEENQVPYDETAIFNGNGGNAPLSNLDGGISFYDMEFTASTQVSVTTGIQTSNSTAVTINPGVTATFDIYEHQPLFFSPASVQLNNGAAGAGGGTVFYNLEAYGQLYAYSGSLDSTIVNITMTNGNNYFEINGPGSNIFDNISSDSTTDEIFITSGSNLTIRGTNTNVIDGVIAGDGSLTKTGTGILTLNNNNTYTGDTLVSEGTLEINGNLSSFVTVSSNATLKGNALINNNLLLSGNIAPGNSIGTVTVTNYTSTSSSVFSCEVNSSGSSDQIIATGSMTLGGTLNVIPLDLSFSSAKTYEILQSNTGILGTFSNRQSTVPSLIALNYGANDVFLTYAPLSALGLHGNAAAAANCFVSLSSSDANSISKELLSLSFSDIQKAFNHMQPSQFSAQTWTQLANTLLVRSSYSEHLREFSFRKKCSDEYQSNLWIDALGQFEQQHRKKDQFGYNDWTAGVSIGSDFLCKKFHFGGAASYTYSQVHLDQSAGHSQINSYYGGLYSGWSDDVGYIMFSALGAYNHYNSSRYLSIGDIKRQAKGSHNGWEVLTGLEGGAYFKVKQLKMGPFGRVDYVYLWQQGYQENGADSLNLHVKSRQDQLIQSQVGIAFTSNYNCKLNSSNGTLIPRIELSYINQTPLAKANYQASFENSNCEFSVSGWNFERNLGAVGASLTYLTSAERLGIALKYDGQFGTKYSNQSGNISFNVKY